MARREHAGPEDRVTPAPAPSAFALSRIQAEGWRAGRLAAASDDAAATQADGLNPYRTAAERDRWRTGFDAARERARR
ncbi:MAG: hypothetical protein HY060_26030 [Proteobacteria bacterium]|nr:hypothetical protein [Pseudomonadota bacterium]